VLLARFCTNCGHPLGSTCSHCHFDNPAAARYCGGCGIPLRDGYANVEGERRPITVLFCDLVDSTALSQRLDPEDFREVQNALRHLSSEVAASHNSHVAQYLGDGVVLYFGYPRAQEDDAERGVRCGLELARRVAALPATIHLDLTLSVRIGIHTSHAALGPVSPDDDKRWTAYGDATNIAARLQAQAEAGGVVVSDVTWNLVPGLFTGHSLGALSLKGVSQPMIAWCVEGEPTGAREQMETLRRLSPLVGREREREILEEAWQAATSGDTQSVLIRAEPGMGKSRLARFWRDRVQTSGAKLLWTKATPNTRAWSLDRADTVGSLEAGNQPFHPIIVLFEQMFGLKRVSSDDDRLARLEGALRELGMDAPHTVPFLAPLFGIPTVGQYALPDISPTRRRNRSLEVITSVIGTLSSGGPTLLIFEDLHWADASTMELMDYVVATLSGLPLLALFTTRPELDVTWGKGTRLRTMDLEKLTRAECEAIARSVARGKALPGDVLRQILTRSDGVPLFVEELTRSALESGVLEERSASWEVVRPPSKELIPVAVHASLAARIDRLGPARATAQLAATIGREFSLALLAAVSDRGEARLRQDLQRLKEAGLAWESGEAGPDVFVFKHALVRDAAYESLLRTTRQTYHGRIAAALRGSLSELATGRSDLIASHLANAGSHEEAVGFWEAAGHEALRRTANLEAAGHFRRAIDCLTTLPTTTNRKARELELQNLIAPVLMSVYGWASTEVEQACQRGRLLAEELGRHDRLYGPLWGLWSVYFLRGELSQALTAAQAVQRMADVSGLPLLQITGRHATSYTRLFRGELEQALEEADAGLALFDFAQERALADAFQLSSTVCLRQSKALALWMLGRLTEADEEAERMLQLARDLDHRSSLAGGLAFALHGGGARYSFTREMVRLGEIADELSRLSQDEGFFMWYAVAEVYRGLIGATLGQEDARNRMMEGLELFVQTRTRVTLVMMNVLVAETLHHAGRDEDALSLLDQAEQEMSQREERLYGPEIWRVRGRLFASQGDFTRAEASYRRALEFAASQKARSLELRATLDLYELLATAGRADEGRARVAATLESVQWPLDRPEVARAHAIVTGSSSYTLSPDWSLSCPTTPPPSHGPRSNGPLSAP
jgi:predicted ATPase/class 3 adenylate cyclase